MEKLEIKLRIFLWIILVGIVGWILYMGIVPIGKISYIYDFTKPNYFINKLTPEERVEPIKNESQKIIGDPVYFSLRTPRRFEKAVLTLKYKTVETMYASSLQISTIEAGVLVDKTVWRYDLEPVENKIIDNLSMVWDKTEKEGIIFLQREKKYETIEDFLDNLPPVDEIAVYNYDLKTNLILKDYEPSNDEHNINYPLRGAYQFYTYIKDEDLDFSFDFSDLNFNKDKDEINLFLYYNGQLIDSRSASEDGGEENGEAKNRGEIAFKLNNLPEGVYKIELKVNDDIITKSIKIKQRKLAFINKIWLYDNNNFELKLYSDSRRVNAQTINPANLQKIKIGESELNLSETYKMFSADAGEGIKEIILEKDDVIISGDGVFSFSAESIINPAIKKVNANLDIKDSSINYVLASYNMPREDDGWKIARVEFDLTGAYREDGKYGFLISIPGLKIDDEIDDWVEVGEIRVDLSGASLWEKIRNYKFKISNSK